MVTYSGLVWGEDTSEAMARAYSDVSSFMKSHNFMVLVRFSISGTRVSGEYRFTANISA